MAATIQGVDLPLVIAHRGASGAFPEHTPLAYSKALEQGADGFECDIQLTADGVLVLHHDSTVDRCTSGTGAVSEMSAAQFLSLDHGSWKGTFEREGHRGMTFVQFLELAKDAGRPLKLFIETKHPSPFGVDVEKEMLRQLARFGWDKPGSDNPVVMMSFAASAVSWFAKMGMPCVYLIQSRHWMDQAELAGGAGIAGPWIEAVRRYPNYVELQHGAGHQVSTWTVNTPDDVQLCVDLGLDAITTNYPDMALKVLGRG